jgi:hypothetical protein
VSTIAKDMNQGRLLALLTEQLCCLSNILSVLATILRPSA